jgi:hypothetical protein
MLDMLYGHFYCNQRTQNLYYSELRHFEDVIRSDGRGLEHNQQFISYNLFFLDVQPSAGYEVS